MNLNQKPIGKTGNIVSCKLKNGKQTSVSVRRKLYTLMCGLFGRKETHAMVRQNFAQFNDGNGGVGASEFIARQLVKQSAAVFASRLKEAIPSAPIPTELTADCEQAVAANPMLNAPVVNLNDPDVQLLTAPVVVAEQTFADYRVTWELMPWSMFAALPECAYQRHTESRAQKALKGHLKTASPTHLVVMATRLGGKLEKLDSHTRTYLQKHRDLARPAALLCFVVHCNSKDDVRRFYDEVDNLAAAEQAKEKVFGTWRSLGYQPKTDFFIHKAKTALQMGMFGTASTREPRDLAQLAVNFVRPLDEDGRGLTKARPPVVGAAITAIRKLHKQGLEHLAFQVSDFLDAFADADAQAKLNKAKLKKQGNSLSRVPPMEGANPAEILAWVLNTSVSLTGFRGQELAYQNALGALSLWLENSSAKYSVENLKPLGMNDFMGPDTAPSKPKECFAHGTNEVASLVVSYKTTTPVTADDEMEVFYQGLFKSDEAVNSAGTSLRH